MPPKLVATTNPDQIRLAIIANYEQWGSRTLTLEQYIEREYLLKNTQFAKNSQTWILVDEDDPMEIYSACETYERPCMASNNDKIIRGNCYSIASVYTPPQHRKKGYAGMMLEMLLQHLKSKDNAIASTLYSDIGPDYYSKKGWKVYPSISLYADLDPSLSYPVPPTVSLMTLRESRPFLEIESTKVQHDFYTKRDTKEFMIIPSYEAQEWHHKRAIFYSKAMAVDQKVVYTGASCNSDFITWSHDIEDSTLYITHLKATSKKSFQQLLLAALAEATKWKFKLFELWDPKKEFLEWAQELNPNIYTKNRSHNLCSLCFWGFEDVDLEWKFNEQHCWV